MSLQTVFLKVLPGALCKQLEKTYVNLTNNHVYLISVVILILLTISLHRKTDL